MSFGCALDTGWGSRCFRTALSAQFATVADPYEDHHVGCGGNADRIARHNALRDAIFSAAQSAALAPRREVSSLIPCSLSRPADVYISTQLEGGLSSSLRCNCYIDHATSYIASKGLLSPKVMLFCLARQENWRSMRMPVKLWESPSSLYNYSCGDPRGNECLICQHFGLLWSTFGDPSC